MTLYDSYETDTSFSYLEKIIQILEEPICILGGWAVYFTVNRNFRNEQGTNYLGSRDIDLGFHITPSMDKTSLSQSPMKKALQNLENDGFQPQGFLYYKEIEYGTTQELTAEEARKKPHHDVFTIFIDPIVDYVHPLFKNIFHFDPADESLLTYVFTNKSKRKEVAAFSKHLWIPTADVLLATKIKSAIHRQKDEKFIKDICDIYTLCWYSDIAFPTIKKSIHHILNNSYFTDFNKRNREDTTVLTKVSIALGIDSETIMNTLEQVSK